MSEYPQEFLDKRAIDRQIATAAFERMRLLKGPAKQADTGRIVAAQLIAGRQAVVASRAGR